MSVTVRRALLSVSNKEGLLEFARELRGRGVTILSTGGTAALLREHGIEVTDVAAVTGFPEIMDGRVKTLHPKIHGGLLGRRGQDDGVMQEHGIEAIDLPPNLQALADRCYHHGGYDDIDYHADPKPPLEPAAAAWATEWLVDQGLR